MAIKRFLTEGGHLFGSDAIPQTAIKPTLLAFLKEMSRLFPKKKKMFGSKEVIKNLLGSAFKKDEPSGDIDIAYDSDQFFKDMESWGIDETVFDAVFAKAQKFGRNYKAAVKSGDEEKAARELNTLRQKAVSVAIATHINNHSDMIISKPDKSGANAIMTAFPQHDTNGSVATDESGNTLMAQVDINIGPIEWLKFSNYSDDYRRSKVEDPKLKNIYAAYDSLPHQGEIKGAHRTQLLLSMFDSVGLTFSHQKGVTDRDTGETASNPDDALKVLNSKFGFDGTLTFDVVKNYHLLHDFIKNRIPEEKYKEIIDIFLGKRLSHQRLDIPADLIPYWIASKERLKLRTDFNPNVQNLTESGVAGGDRIMKSDVMATVEDYVERVLKPKYPDVKYKIAGSYNLGTRNDHGDIDLIILVPGTDKKEIKKDLAKYVSSLPNELIVPFRSDKYKNRRFYNSGEIVTVLYPIKGGKGAVQIDNIISTTPEEQSFKFEFLKLPAEKQGLILGLFKSTMIDNPEVAVKLNLPIEDLSENQEYEFNLSSDKLVLRVVTYDPALLQQGKYKEINRDIVWVTKNWNIIPKILSDYDLNDDFSGLIEQIRKKASKRAKNRIAGVFKSMVSVKSGEQGTPKGAGKERAREEVESLLSEERIPTEHPKTVGIYDLSGKPVQKGHWDVIKKAASENEWVLLNVSLSDRATKGSDFVILGNDMKNIWMGILSKLLPKNVHVQYTPGKYKSPVEASYEKLKELDASGFKGAVNMYYGGEDAGRYKAIPKYAPNVNVNHVPLERLHGISGTKMREFLQTGDKESFIANSPDISPEFKEKMWQILTTKKNAVEQVREIISSLF
jgi:hypothetical protein